MHTIRAAELDPERHLFHHATRVHRMTSVRIKRRQVTVAVEHYLSQSCHDIDAEVVVSDL